MLAAGEDPLIGRRLGDEGSRCVDEAFRQESLWTTQLKNYEAWFKPS